jgi:hypothetical protein
MKPNEQSWIDVFRQVWEILTFYVARGRKSIRAPPIIEHSRRQTVPGCQPHEVKKGYACHGESTVLLLK